MNIFFKKAGVMAIGTRLRMITERVAKDSEKMFELHGIDIKPKWFSVFFSLSHTKELMTITSLAKELGYAHPSVILIIKEMKENDLIIEKKDKKDGRKTIISLSKKAKEMANLIEEQYIDVNNAIEKILKETNHNLWLAIEDFEKQLDKKSIYSRVLEEKILRENKPL